MPEIFPTWMTSPLFMYGVPSGLGGLFLFFLLRGVLTRRWRGLGLYAVFLIVGGLVAYTGFQAHVKNLFKDFQFPIPPGQVYVQLPTMMPFENKIEALGTAEANESAAITSNVTRTIKALYVKEGQWVKKGTVIALLDDAAEQAALREAELAYNRSAQLLKANAISAARVDSDRARLDIARAGVNDRKILAPFDGILGLRSLSVGDIVNAGMTITTIDDVDPIKLEFSVPEIYMVAVRIGLVVHAESDAYPGTIFEGVVTATSPRIDPSTRSIKVKAELDNRDGRLRAGMLMRVNVVQDSRTALAISEEALVSKGQQKMVMIAGLEDKDGFSEVIARPVTIGTRAPGYVEITSGLVPSDRVVVEGVIKARPQGKVKVMGDRSIDQTVTRALSQAVQGKQDEIKPENHELIKEDEPNTSSQGAEYLSSPSQEKPKERD